MLRLGECAALTQRWQEAENVYRRFAREFPESSFLNRGLFGQGWALENQERYEDAIRVYEKVLARGQFDETSARSQFQIGECHFSLKKYDEAVKALIKVEVLFAFPKWSSKAILEAGRALALSGKKEEARARFREVIQKYPKSDVAVVAQKKLEALDNE
jgi:TolA-binding protein